jgi:hypothetical protein
MAQQHVWTQSWNWKNSLMSPSLKVSKNLRTIKIRILMRTLPAAVAKSITHTITHKVNKNNHSIINRSALKPTNLHWTQINSIHKKELINGNKTVGLSKRWRSTLCLGNKLYRQPITSITPRIYQVWAATSRGKGQASDLNQLSTKEKPINKPLKLHRLKFHNNLKPHLIKPHKCLL